MERGWNQDVLGWLRMASMKKRAGAGLAFHVLDRGREGVPNMWIEEVQLCIMVHEFLAFLLTDGQGRLPNQPFPYGSDSDSPTLAESFES